MSRQDATRHSQREAGCQGKQHRMPSLLRMAASTSCTREPSDRPRCLLLLQAFTSCSAAIAMYTAVLLVPSSSLRYGKWYPPEMKDAERSKFGYEAWQQMQKFCTVYRHRFGGSSRQQLPRGCRWLQMLEAPPAEDVLKREQALPSEPQPAAPPWMIGLQRVHDESEPHCRATRFALPWTHADVVANLWSKACGASTGP